MKLVPHLQHLLGFDTYDYLTSSMLFRPCPMAFDMAAVYAAATVQRTLVTGRARGKSMAPAYRIVFDDVEQEPRTPFFHPVLGMPYGHSYS